MCGIIRFQILRCTSVIHAIMSSWEPENHVCVILTTGKLAVYELSHDVLWINWYTLNIEVMALLFLLLLQSKPCNFSWVFGTHGLHRELFYIIFMCRMRWETARRIDRRMSQVSCVGSATVRSRQLHGVWGISDELCLLPWLLWKC